VLWRERLTLPRQSKEPLRLASRSAEPLSVPLIGSPGGLSLSTCAAGALAQNVLAGWGWRRQSVAVAVLGWVNSPHLKTGRTISASCVVRVCFFVLVLL